MYHRSVLKTPLPSPRWSWRWLVCPEGDCPDVFLYRLVLRWPCAVHRTLKSSYLLTFLYRPGLWHKAKKVTLTAGQTDIKVGLSLLACLSCSWLTLPVLALHAGTQTLKVNWHTNCSSVILKWHTSCSFQTDTQSVHFEVTLKLFMLNWHTICSFWSDTRAVCSKLTHKLLKCYSEMTHKLFIPNWHKFVFVFWSNTQAVHSKAIHLLFIPNWHTSCSFWIDTQAVHFDTQAVHSYTQVLYSGW